CSRVARRLATGRYKGSGQLVLRPGAALGWGQTATLGRDRAALDAVRRGDLDRDLSVTLAHLVDLRRAHPRPQLAELPRDLPLDPEMVRRAVSRLVAAQDDRRELAE